MPYKKPSIIEYFAPNLCYELFTSSNSLSSGTSLSYSFSCSSFCAALSSLSVSINLKRGLAKPLIVNIIHAGPIYIPRRIVVKFHIKTAHSSTIIRNKPKVLKKYLKPIEYEFLKVFIIVFSYLARSAYA